MVKNSSAAMEEKCHSDPKPPAAHLLKRLCNEIYSEAFVIEIWRNVSCAVFISNQLTD